MGAIGMDTLFSLLTPDIAVSTTGVETSKGYSLVIGLDLMQLLVCICTLAARTILQGELNRMVKEVENGIHDQFLLVYGSLGNYFSLS